MRRAVPCPESLEFPEIQWRHCSRCRESWPATDDFFWRYSQKKGARLQCSCKACHSENAQERKAEKEGDVNWQLSNRASKRALPLADRHYSRQKVGTSQFVKPGSCLVLMSLDGKALWVTSWPKTEFVKHAWAGAWECSMFRNEGATLASDLITHAVAATRAVYGTPPPLGFVSFIDPRKVRPTVVRGLPTFGYSWLKAGWRYLGTTAAGLLAFGQAPSEMPAASPPLGYTPSLFEESPIRPLEANP